MTTGPHGASAVPTVWPGRHHELGATPDEQGTNFAVWAPAATCCWLCLFDDRGHESRIELTEQTLEVWHGYLAGIGPGQRYGFRVDGPWDPARNQLFHPDKLLLDPYARAIAGDLTVDPTLSVQPHYGARNDGDTAPFVPRSVVVGDDDFDWRGDVRPQVPWDRTVIYEAHVRGMTRLHPEVPDDIKGTYAGFAHPAIVEYLVDLGVTAVELMPVQAFVSEVELSRLGLTNYWGYNTIGYFAPHAGYSSSGCGGGQVSEFKYLVRTLHEAGIEVILDVVYNHTAEGPVTGPVLSFRGLDDRTYYRNDGWGRYADVTGCGNTVDVSEPAALRLVMDSLRYWVQEMHVDGFRFDLAAALLRNGPNVDLRAPFLTAVHQDPVLRQVKLIAEPWDATADGYLVGRFPPLWSEWNDRYRDAVRDFWRGKSAGVRDVASRISGSSDLYGDHGRSPSASVNFVTAHDGFTLRDLVSYDDKHNEANGEHNRDGSDDNRSWNCGVEGETDDPEVRALRRRQASNLLATLLLSTGVPMLTAGDERGRTQRGNNNAFCHDSPVSWVSWDENPEWKHLHDLTRTLLRLRAKHPVLSKRTFFRGAPRDGGSRKDLVWLRSSGDEMTAADWEDTGLRTLGALLDGDGLRSRDHDGNRRVDSSFVLYLHAGDEPVDVTLPVGARHYLMAFRTDGSASAVPVHPGEEVRLAGHTLALLQATPLP